MADREEALVRGDDVVVVAGGADARVDQSFRVAVEIVLPDAPVGVKEHHIASFQPVRGLDHPVEAVDGLYFARLRVEDVEVAGAAVPALAQLVQRIIDRLEVGNDVLFKLVLIDDLGDAHGPGELVTGNHIQRARAGDGFGFLPVEILVVQRFHPVPVAPEQRLGVRTGIHGPAHVDLGVDFAEAEVQEVFVGALAAGVRLKLRRLVVQQQPGARVGDGVGGVHVVQRGLL